MPLVEFASPISPGAKTATSTTSVTSNSFSPPGGSLTVVMASWGFTTSGGSTIAITSSDGLGGWTQLISGALNTLGSSAYIWYRYSATPPGSITVTTTKSGTGGQSMLQVVKVLRGASPVQSGGATKTVNPGSGSNTTDFTTTITPSVSGSKIYGICVNGVNANALTISGSFTNLGTDNDGTNGVYHASERTTTFTDPSAGAVTMGFTAASPGGGGTLVLAEILPVAPGNNFNTTVYRSNTF